MLFAHHRPPSVDAILRGAQAWPKDVAGKTCMDRNAPKGCAHPRNPPNDEARHSLTAARQGPRQLCDHAGLRPTVDARTAWRRLGRFGRNAACMMQTHLSEQVDEIAWVKDLCWSCRELSWTPLRRTTGWCVTRGLWSRDPSDPPSSTALRISGASVVHCPTSNTFYRSGFVRQWPQIRARRIPSVLATDTGADHPFPCALRWPASLMNIGQLARQPPPTRHKLECGWQQLGLPAASPAT